MDVAFTLFRALVPAPALSPVGALTETSLGGWGWTSLFLMAPDSKLFLVAKTG